MGGSTIWLVGMMGAGKTAVGRALAERLGVPFFDSDEEIERRSGHSVAEIFARRGEAGFRELERKAIGALSGTTAVVALGGGAIAEPGMAERLGRSGTVVYLRATPETLSERVGEGEGRPLLAGLDARERKGRLRALLAQRKIHYGSASITIDTDGATVEQLAQRLAQALEQAEEDSVEGEGGS